MPQLATESAPPTQRLSLASGILEKLILIRRFEERLLDLFAAGELKGTVHTCIGQELTGVAVAEALQRDDIVLSNHRGHGHFLAHVGDVDGLLAEIMGRRSGVCRGVGGSQHLWAESFLSNGILGGMVPIAVGWALAEKMKGSRRVVTCFMGDGALGEGAVYEAWNLAACWGAPALFVVEVNGIAQSTPTASTFAGSLASRAEGFGIELVRGDTGRPEALLRQAAQAVERVRQRCAPVVLEIATVRLKSHSKGDDTRSADDIARLHARDPLGRALGRARPAERLAAMVQAADEKIARAVELARRAPAADTPPPVSAARRSATGWVAAPQGAGRIGTHIHEALGEGLARHPNLFLFGEDIEGPYGGAFKITRDLSLRFPGRVRNAPISEAGLAGAANGLAAGGILPVLEIMFGDFITLTFDQIVQHAAKFGSMTGGRMQMPWILRTPMGGRRGYGPTHSQSLEKFFLGIDGIDILALNQRVHPGAVYGRLFETIRRPTLVIENKLLYARPLAPPPPAGFDCFASDEMFPTVRVSPRGRPADATVLCYGGMLAEAEEAAAAAFDQHELAVEIICPSRLQPHAPWALSESVARTGVLICAEEGPSTAAFGSELLARLMERDVVPRAFRRVGNNSIIPSSAAAEDSTLPGAASIVAAACEACHG